MQIFELEIILCLIIRLERKCYTSNVQLCGPLGRCASAARGAIVSQIEILNSISDSICLTFANS